MISASRLPSYPHLSESSLTASLPGSTNTTRQPLPPRAIDSSFSYLARHFDPANATTSMLSVALATMASVSVPPSSILLSSRTTPRVRASRNSSMASASGPVTRGENTQAKTTNTPLPIIHGDGPQYTERTMLTNTAPITTIRPMRRPRGCTASVAALATESITLTTIPTIVQSPWSCTVDLREVLRHHAGPIIEPMRLSNGRDRLVLPIK